MPLAIVKVTQQEYETVLRLLVGAATWLRTQGIHQWEHYLEPEGDGPADLAAAIGRGEVYLAMDAGRPVGTISLQPSPSEWDRAVWGAEANAADALYIHRLAIDRVRAGSGVGGAMLDWAEAQARATGKRFLRLDCVGQNARLNAYYARRFAFRGETPHYGRTFSKYEQELVK